MKNITAKKIMTSPAVSVSTRTSLRQLIKILDRTRFGGLPVVNKDKKVVGMISEKDVLKYTRCIIGGPVRNPRQLLDKENESARVSGQRGLDVIEFVASATVAALMIPDVVSASETTSVLDVIETMNRRKINRVPVVDAAGKLTGIVTKTDILKMVEKWMKANRTS